MFKEQIFFFSLQKYYRILARNHVTTAFSFDASDR